MINGVNINEELNNAQLNGQMGISGISSAHVTNPYKNLDRNLLIDETAISNQAINLYEKDQDISKFNKLAMSNPENLSHEEIVANLFNKGISDPFSEETISELAVNKRLLTDLDL